MATPQPIPTEQRDILREFARQVADIAALPIQHQRREQWKLHNSLQSKRPMIWIKPEGAWRELLPESALRCEHPRARQMETQLRQAIYYHDHFCDDNLVEPTWTVHRAIGHTGWGLQPEWTPSTQAHGARAFKPVINTPADMNKLRQPDVVEDQHESRRRLAEAQDLFGDILDVRQVGVAHISFHLMAEYTALRGLEQVMTDMIENPTWLHDAMSFLTEAHQRMLDQYQQRNLLTLNNDWTYHNSGGNGYTDELPPPDFNPDHVRLADMWGSAEAQELALVSPEMHDQFSLQYERQLLKPFALNGYGCCEDLTRKLDDVFKITNIRRISIAPFADVESCARQIADRAIFSWKPDPAHLVGKFNEDRVRAYIRHTLDVTQANGCIVEMILKDTHTCEHQTERFDTWCRIARQEVQRVCPDSGTP